ncbi:MAG: NAD-dependent deacylase [Flavobacteriaceae bacterium]|nr:NAD-dependent deacylase [Flavobacteriaceae bacterium]
MNKKLVAITGAGISAESGIKTFRDSNGLWENHDIMEVASPQGWQKNQALVLEFYNQRRRQLHKVKPNKAHHILADLEQHFDIQVITQNIDDLHERAGSTNILHLHGELFKSRSSNNSNYIYEQKDDIKLGDKAEDDAQLRPHIVWFGEEVPLIPKAAEHIAKADIVLVIGTSMQVYPAAGLVNYISEKCQLIVINPDDTDYNFEKRAVHIKEKAVKGMEALYKVVLENKL